MRWSETLIESDRITYSEFFLWLGMVGIFLGGVRWLSWQSDNRVVRGRPGLEQPLRLESREGDEIDCWTGQVTSRQVRFLVAPLETEPEFEAYNRKLLLYLLGLEEPHTFFRLWVVKGGGEGPLEVDWNRWGLELRVRGKKSLPVSHLPLARVLQARGSQRLDRYHRVVLTALAGDLEGGRVVRLSPGEVSSLLVIFPGRYPPLEVESFRITTGQEEVELGGRRVSREALGLYRSRPGLILPGQPE